MRLRRSVLYMPGSNARALEKARSLAADALILDLEDAVAPAAKQQGRDNIAAALAQGGYGYREVVVRINGLDTPWWQADLASLAGLSCDAVLIPKVNNADDVLKAEQAMREAGLSDAVEMWLMAETPACIVNIDSIVMASSRVSVIVMGTSDLGKELRVNGAQDRIGFAYVLGRCVVAARMAGLDIIDGVYGELNDDEGFVAACEQGVALGFDGKSLVHPKQLAPCNDLFAPASADLQKARDIIAAWDAADEQSGIVVVDGKMIEELHVVQARRAVAFAEALASRGE